MRWIKHRSPIILTAIAALALSACGDDATSSSDSVERPTTDVSASSTESPATPDHTDDVTSSSAPATVPTRADQTTPPSSDKPALAPTPTEATVTTSPSDDTIANSSMVQSAIADLRERLNIDPSTIEVLQVEDVTWRDGSIGCPSPGMNYTQALVDGTRILLQVEFVTYSYHSAESGEPFYCPADRAMPPIADPRL